MKTIRKSFFTFYLVIFGVASLHAQSNKKDSVIQPPPIVCYLPTPDSMKAYSIPDVQVKPAFYTDVKKYLADSIKYPDEARKKNIQGTVYIGFVIEKNGSVSNVRVLQSSRSTLLDNEAKRVVSMMPRWMPGKKNEKPVRVQDIMPVHFKL